MKRSNGSLPPESRAALISIHPEHAQKIIAGEKRIEFRRRWAVAQFSVLVLYATSPIKRIVGLAEVKRVVIGSKTKLWGLAKVLGGGVTRTQLFAYMKGSKNGVAIELDEVRLVLGGLDPSSIFGDQFRPPQSFRYLKEQEYAKIYQSIGLGNCRREDQCG